MFDSVFFGVPDGDVRVAEGAVRGAPATLGHGEDEAAEALGGPEAKVEDAGLVSDRFPARVSRPHLHDEGRSGRSHPEHHRHPAYGESRPPYVAIYVIYTRKVAGGIEIEGWRERQWNRTEHLEFDPATDAACFLMK